MPSPGVLPMNPHTPLRAWIQSLFRRKLSSTRQTASRRSGFNRQSRALELEPLEDRTLLNVAPVLTLPAGPFNVVKTATLAIQATATDRDLDKGQTLTFSLLGAPTGATINSSSGLITWTPTEDQGPASFSFTVKVIDDGKPVRA